MANIRKIDTMEEYNDLLKMEGKIIVFKFYASWCEKINTKLHFFP